MQISVATTALNGRRFLQVMWVSQLPLLAPGPSLADQLTYPSGDQHPDQAMLDVLQAVGLYHLLQRLDHNLYMPYSWEGIKGPN